MTLARAVNCRMIKAALLPLAVAALLPAKMALAAGSATATLSVTATIQASCTLTTTPVGFGVYDPTAAGDNKANGTITVTCAAGTTPVVALDNGTFSAKAPALTKTSSGVQVTRAMQTSGNFLGYDLFTDVTYSTIWNATNTVSPGQLGSTQPVVLTVFGDIPKGQTTTGKGSFADTVVVTVTF